MTWLLAIDPGPEQSAWVILDEDRGAPLGWAKVPNVALLDHISATTADRLAVEMIASYGMPVGREVFETCTWIGRFVERWAFDCDPAPRPFTYVYRRDVKLHLCGSVRAKDSNVRQALIDRYGPGKDRAVGRKATPGPLYGLTGDCWAALGVAVTVADGMAQEAAA